jgi:hypothetical protein
MMRSHLSQRKNNTKAMKDTLFPKILLTSVVFLSACAMLEKDGSVEDVAIDYSCPEDEICSGIRETYAIVKPDSESSHLKDGQCFKLSKKRRYLLFNLARCGSADDHTIKGRNFKARCKKSEETIPDCDILTMMAPVQSDCHPGERRHTWTITVEEWDGGLPRRFTMSADEHVCDDGEVGETHGGAAHLTW